MIWGPITIHDGNGYPAPPGSVAEVWFLWNGLPLDGGVVTIGAAGGDSWTWREEGGGLVCPDGATPIAAYRLRRPPAVQLLVDIAETLPVREREDA